ncbi:MAG: hypothetical protein KDD82_15585 [Planctomycetes bacterium]|nr:hypothetical protein [Planctomycetota bacterium]
MLRVALEQAISQPHDLTLRPLYLARVDGEWALGEALKCPVASFVSSHRGAQLVALSPEPAVLLNGRRLTLGVSYPLRPGDRVQAGPASLRLTSTDPAAAAFLRRWAPLALLLGLFASSGYVALRVSAAGPAALSPPRADLEPVGAEQRLVLRALAEAAGLERLGAYREAAEVLERAEAQLSDPLRRRDLNRKRAELLALAATEPAVAAVDSGATSPPPMEPPADPPPAAPPPVAPQSVDPPSVDPPPDDPPPVEPPPPPPDSGASPADAAREPPPPAPKGPQPGAEDAEAGFFARVTAAIDGGSTYLQSTALNPRRPGEFALIAFALLRSGVDPEAPTVRRMFAGFQDAPLDQTYDLAVAILALEARSIKRIATPSLGGTRTVARFRRRQVPAADLERIRGFAQQLLGGQTEGGDWGYACPAGGTRVTPAPRAAQTDNSNTQFAVLALHAAARAGASVPEACWQRVLSHFTRTASEREDAASAPLTLGEHSPELFGPTDPSPESQRGWAYRPPPTTYKTTPAMTAAGLSSLVIAADALRQAQALDDDGFAAAALLARQAATWLAHSFRGEAPPHSTRPTYLLYSIEKAMEVGGIELLDGKDWYRSAAEDLLRRQRSNGGWGNAIDTSLALLVLNRATLHLSGGTRARGGTALAPLRPLTVEARGQEVDLPERLSALAQEPTPRKELSLLRAAIKALPEVDRPRLAEALALLLDGEEEATRRFATQQLQGITGEALDPDGYRAWARRYRVLYDASYPLDAQEERALSEALSAPQDGPLTRVAALAAVRGRALFAVTALVQALWHLAGPTHAEACSALRALTGEDPVPDGATPEAAAAAWRAWLPGKVEALRRRGLVEDFVAGHPRAREARGELLALGREVVPALLEAYALRPDASWIPGLLQELTGLDPEPTPAAWRAAWAAQR